MLTRMPANEFNVPPRNPVKSRMDHGGELGGELRKAFMKRQGNLLTAWGAIGIALVTLASLVFAQQVCAAEPGKIDFARDVQPILSDKCFLCHGPDGGTRKADLRLDVLDPKLGPFAARDGYAVITPKSLDDSVMVMRITSDDDEVKMPPPKSNRTLTAAQIDILKQWIEQGAQWGKHWSFDPPRRPELPAVTDEKWAKNPIDRFIVARLDKEGLKPSPPAPNETLIRRVTLDLTGLPPTPSEVDAFFADESTDAYEKLVDRLLASPRYGERMVWEWLDIARYADTNGYQNDSTRTMWPWRDWAVRAINDNLPFDQFTIKQLAGDLMPDPRAVEADDAARDVARDDKIATAFLRNHMINGEGGRIPEENRVDYVMDQTETVSTAFLGLTVGCARCHDHKFDPISQKDYYSLSAFFNQTPVDGGGGNGQTAPLIDFTTPQQTEKLKQLAKLIKEKAAVVTEIETTVFPRPSTTQPTTQPTTKASTQASTQSTTQASTRPASESPGAAGLSGNLIAALKQPAEKRNVPFLVELINTFKEKEPKYAAALQELHAAVDEREKFNTSIPRVMVMEDMPKPRETFVLVKGSYDKHAGKVDANTLSALPPLPTGVKKDRLALANWLFAPEHPLTARVAVNRAWQQFFGIGLVKTVDDFGVQGERPPHESLLDWLAVQYRDSKWDTKALHRLLVTSSTYRQSSKMTPQSFERDPENRLLARGARYRLPAFVIRDQALAASGLLVEQIGGAPVKTYQPEGVWEEATFGQIKYEQDHGDALYRRSLYIFWRRIVGPTQFFDTAARQTCTMKTSRTNTPLHALATLNDPAFVEAARTLAQRVMTAGDSDSPTKRLDLACRLVLSRKPSEQERIVLLASLDRLKSEYAKDLPAAEKLLAVGESKRNDKLDPIEHAAYTGVCLAILNLDEAMTKE
ncbi:MAG: PSD1 and planctomycete cytochrome C domain-containing protein [Tepidisphaeraceae bacterium]